jgi:hypothetical protein
MQRYQYVALRRSMAVFTVVCGALSFGIAWGNDSPTFAWSTFVFIAVTMGAVLTWRDTRA